MTDNIVVDVQIASTLAGVPDHVEIRRWVIDTVTEIAANKHCEIAVRVVDEDEGRSLNARYRGKDYATNVLSFRSGEDIPGLPSKLPAPLGDIVVCGPVVEREAKEQRKSLNDHWAHLLVHGALHLLEHDHEQDTDARRMEALETKILEAGGIGDPYRE